MYNIYKVEIELKSKEEELNKQMQENYQIISSIEEKA